MEQKQIIFTCRVNDKDQKKEIVKLLTKLKAKNQYKFCENLLFALRQFNGEV